MIWGTSRLRSADVDGGPDVHDDLVSRGVSVCATALDHLKGVNGRLAADRRNCSGLGRGVEGQRAVAYPLCAPVL